MFKRFRVDKKSEGKRLDVYIASKYPKFSRSSLERLFKDRLVTIGNQPAKASHHVSGDEIINIDDTYLKQKAPKIDLPILYQDENVMVIDKPEGVLTHSKGALNTEASVASFIQPYIKDAMLTGNRAGIVHRLDRATSGVIITALNSPAQSLLQKQFAQRKAKKSYITIVHGTLDPKEAIIDAPIARNPSKPQTFRVDANGKPAQTEYKVLEVITKNKQTYSLVELRPKTGRTHQLRVHMAYIKHPIAGDNVYGKDKGNLMLHAKELEITIPKGQRKVFKAEIPKRLTDFEGN